MEIKIDPKHLIPREKAMVLQSLNYVVSPLRFRSK